VEKTARTRWMQSVAVARVANYRAGVWVAIDTGGNLSIRVMGFFRQTYTQPPHVQDGAIVKDSLRD